MLAAEPFLSNPADDEEEDPPPGAVGGGGGGGGGGGDFLLWAASGDEGELLDAGELEEEVDEEPTLICARNSAGKLSLPSSLPEMTSTQCVEEPHLQSYNAPRSSLAESLLYLLL